MKTSELIELLKKEIEIGGDNEVIVFADLGKDEEGVLRCNDYNNVTVNTGASASIDGKIHGFTTIINCKK